MKRMIWCLMVIGVVLLFAGSAMAQPGLVRTVEEGCQKETVGTKARPPCL